MSQPDNVYQHMEIPQAIYYGLYSWKGAFGLFVTSFTRNAQYLAPISACISSASYFSSTFLLVVHFIYRYFAVIREDMLKWFKYPYGLIWVVAFIVYCFDLCITMMQFFQPDQESKEYVRSYFMENYGVNVDHVYLTVGRYFDNTPDGVKMRWGVIIRITNLAFINTMAMVIICIISWKLYQTLKLLESITSKYVKRLQMQFFKVLAIQTTIPFVTEFLPAIVYYILSMFGLEIGIYDGNVSRVESNPANFMSKSTASS
ncbi:hypothetical protein WR25_03109 [Diploscapter pachys]|uniref:G-protein coupled receptors family 1 profile domain-containing protein n=1 Tax=Diploscapter pachys TaxID=2018661 RepID=A0A2A2JGD2_9BILA|nr:hypothetical protein WR25_03109 [Diploscapter pachys]